jgi:uncharacterized membrane protein
MKEAPNPTSGFLIMVKEDEVRDVDWSVAEAMNAVVSCGLIGPEKIGKGPPPVPERPGP